MLQKFTQRSIRYALQRQVPRRLFGDQIIKSDAVAKNVIAVEQPQVLEINQYNHDALKQYFDQDAYLYPIEQIIERVEVRDYRFFLQNKNFLKVVDTLEKFQKEVVDLDSQAGRDFIVFKRQLYQIYEVQNRSVEEHEAFSFELERQNLLWLYNAKQDFSKEMERQGFIEDLEHHGQLQGKIFKRKMLSPKRLEGLGYFGVGGLLWGFFPHVALHIGQTATMLGLTGSLLMGMTAMVDKNTINSIELISEGDRAGQLKFNVSISPIASRNLYANVNDVQSMITVGNDDLGEDGVESNLVNVRSSTDDSGNTHSAQILMLPADAWKDPSMLDWILSIKNESSNELDDLFNDYMVTAFSEKANTGGISKLGVLAVTGAGESHLSGHIVDQDIDQGDSSLDANLALMEDFYGPEKMSQMSNQEFYANYKKFATGQTF